MRRYYDPVDYSTRWVRIPQPRYVDSKTIVKRQQNADEGRHFQPDTIYKISETLGALNTVGRYIVNMTRGIETDTSLQEDVPGAIYTLTKNVLGRNVTDTIAPLVREALPSVRLEPVSKTTTEAPNTRVCTTPDGQQGYCDDLSDCPQLLLNLGNLRQSLCFKSLFVPGVCCPRTVNELGAPSSTITSLIRVTTRAPFVHLSPVTTARPFVQVPLAPATTIAPTTTTSYPDIIGNYVDPEGMF